MRWVSSFISPLVDAIQKTEGNDSIAFVLLSWMQAEAAYRPVPPSHDAGTFLFSMNKLITEALLKRRPHVFEDIHFAAFLLNPNTRNIALEEDYYPRGIRLIGKLCGDAWENGLYEQFMQFRS